jgi:hypothetical protein
VNDWVTACPGGEHECKSLMTAAELAMLAALHSAADNKTRYAFQLHAAGLRLYVQVDRLIQRGARGAGFTVGRIHVERLLDWVACRDCGWARDTRRVLAAALAADPEDAASAPEAVVS